MGLKIIKQPDDRLAVWDSANEGFVVRDASADEVVEYFVQRAASEAREAMAPLVHGISSLPYGEATGWFTDSFEEVVNAQHAEAIQENASR